MQKTQRYVVALTAVLAAGGLFSALGHPAGPVWDEYDVNEDGTITAEEFAAVGSEKVAELQARFLAAFDTVPEGATAGDGVITAEESTAVFEDQAADWLERVLKAYDTNGDGAISSADRPFRLRHVRQALREYDTDDDGVVTAAELAAEAESRVAENLERLLAKYDSVAEGEEAGDGIITAEESTAVHQSMVDARIDAILERFDTNADGSVTEAEVEAVLEDRPKRRPGMGRR